MKRKPILSASLLILAAFITIIMLFDSCKKPMKTEAFNHLPNINSPHYNSLKGFDSTQVIFFAVKNDGISDEKFEKDILAFRKDFEKKYHPSYYQQCGTCNTEIFIYVGDSIPTFISGQTASSGGTKGTGGSVHGDGELLWSANYGINFSDSIEPLQQFPVLNSNPGNIKKIAVLDTGIDTTGISSQYFYHNEETSCLGSDANNGWNLVSNNHDWHDDNAQRHGTIVTRFILNEVNTNGRIGAKILPVKTHNAAGQSDFYSILCALSYAADRKVDLVNASFGFYTDNLKNPNSSKVDSASVLLLKTFVERYLTQKNIVLVAAAGNVLPGHIERNLDLVSFYPASLSETLGNVISATTVRKSDGAVSPRENYSSHVVNIGVNADTLAFDSINKLTAYVFFDPLHNGRIVRGSSFAAPIATGNICSYYDLYSMPSGLNNRAILSNLFSQGVIVRNNPSLGNFIVDNNVMFKRAHP